MEKKLFQLLNSPDYVPLKAEDIIKELKFPREQQRSLVELLQELERDGRVVRMKGRRWGLPQPAELIPGRIRMNRQGKGSLDPDDHALPQITIPEHSTNTAMHGDRVLVRLDDSNRSGDSTGKVIRILDRVRKQLVGTLKRTRQFLVVIPDDPRLPQDIYVPEPHDVGRPAREGDKVVVELKNWESRHTSPEGEIIEVLGAPDEEGVDMLSVLRHHNLPLRFPKKVLQEAKQLGLDIYIDSNALSALRPEWLKDRVDCRSHQVITIDPVDAKDFDDAICIQQIEGRQWRVWVHIADVSFYVKPGTALDEEAKNRGNSTYLVDRVIPMLPEALSNELCSLKPGVERLTKCAEFILGPEGRVRKVDFYSAVIHSKRRFSYQEALEVLNRKPGTAIEQMLHQAHQLAQRLRRHRMQEGSLDFDFPETKIRLDEEGRIERIEKIENDVSHQLIEEFMLLANEAVAARLMQQQRSSIYRVHEPPEPQRLEEFRQELLQHDIRCGNLNQRSEVQRLLRHLDTLPIGAALKVSFLRSLMRARYAKEPLGHYGLAKKKYTHFTSPIRRYADLVVHRSLYGSPKDLPGANEMFRIADHISQTERNSDDAERASRDVKMFSYLKEQISSGRREIYPAMVTDVRNFGFFVDVPALGVSGAVPLSSIESDFFVFDRGRDQLTGRRTREIIRIGKQLQVKVLRVDTYKKQIDFEWVWDQKKSSGPSGRPKPPASGRRAEALHPRQQDNRKRGGSWRRRRR